MLIRIIFSLDLESQLGVIVYISNMNSLFVRFLWVGVPFLWILGLHAQGNLQFNQVKLVQARMRPSTTCAEVNKLQQAQP